MGQWYAIWTRSRHEAVVRDQLRERKIEAFLPTIPRWSRWKDRKKKIDWPLFPGYVFVQMRMDDDTWYVVRNTPGVTGFAGVTGDDRSRPTPLADTEVNRILRQMEVAQPRINIGFKEGEQEIAQLEKDGAKDSDIKGRQRIIDRDVASIRERLEQEIDLVTRTWDEFKGLHARKIIDDASAILMTSPFVEKVLSAAEIAATPMPHGSPETWTLAERARAFGMSVLACDPYLTAEEIAARGAEIAAAACVMTTVRRRS